MPLGRTVSRAYIELAIKIARIDRTAARYFLSDAAKLSSFNWSTAARGNYITLSNVYLWQDTPQGHVFWARIHRELYGH